MAVPQRAGRLRPRGRRILVVVDNASSAGQAGPLKPTAGITAALVASRHTFDGPQRPTPRPRHCRLHRCAR